MARAGTGARAPKGPPHSRRQSASDSCSHGPLKQRGQDPDGAGRPSTEGSRPSGAGWGRLPLAGYGLLSLLAGSFYFWDLDGPHIPKNGDECPYEQITRLTAQTRRLLPLQSAGADLRNTKPPLLFWQGLASTQWGQRWTLWNLRYPSVVYTLLTALLVFALSARLSGEASAGFLGSASFLGFFSTYRYGRPFLTNPPEVFWLSLPFFLLLYFGPRALASRYLFPLLAGTSFGLALLYKSFALALPAGLGLALFYLHQRGYDLAAFRDRDSGKVALALGLSLALFGLWFLADPDPAAVWRDFVLRENVGKLAPPGTSYFGQLLWGTSSLWSLSLGYPLNAGLLFFPMLALFVLSYQRRRELGSEERLLWIWVLLLFAVFSLPSQRSGRYLLPAMPALAVLLALNAERIPRRAFAASLFLTAALVAGIAYLSSRLQDALPGRGLYPLGHWLLLAGTGGLTIFTLVRPGHTRVAASPTALLGLLCLASFLRPFDGAAGRYPAALERSLADREVWVPVDFVAGEERYRFLLPGADVHGYAVEAGMTVPELLVRYPRIAVSWSLQDPVPGPGRILGQRLDLRGRQSPRQLLEILRGRVDQSLFRRELLLERPGLDSETPPVASGASR